MTICRQRQRGYVRLVPAYSTESDGFFVCEPRHSRLGIELARLRCMSVHAIRRRCILCSSPMLGISKPATPDVCFICGLSEEEHKRFDTEEDLATVPAKPTHPRRRRPALRSV